LFSNSFGVLWAMFWHHPWCLRASQKHKKRRPQIKQIKCFSEASESLENSVALRIKFKALFSRWNMHFLHFPHFLFFSIHSPFTGLLKNPFKDCLSTFQALQGPMHEARLARLATSADGRKDLMLWIHPVHSCHWEALSMSSIQYDHITWQNVISFDELAMLMIESNKKRTRGDWLKTCL